MTVYMHIMTVISFSTNLGAVIL